MKQVSTTELVGLEHREQLLNEQQDRLLDEASQPTPNIQISKLLKEANEVDEEEEEEAEKNVIVN